VLWHPPRRGGRQHADRVSCSPTGACCSPARPGVCADGLGPRAARSCVSRREGLSPGGASASGPRGADRARCAGADRTSRSCGAAAARRLLVAYPCSSRPHRPRPERRAGQARVAFVNQALRRRLTVGGEQVDVTDYTDRLLGRSTRAASTREGDRRGPLRRRPRRVIIPPDAIEKLQSTSRSPGAAAARDRGRLQRGGSVKASTSSRRSRAAARPTTRQRAADARNPYLTSSCAALAGAAARRDVDILGLTGRTQSSSGSLPARVGEPRREVERVARFRAGRDTSTSRTRSSPRSASRVRPADRDCRAGRTRSTPSRSRVTGTFSS
jgi:hypothetical protein